MDSRLRGNDKGSFGMLLNDGVGFCIHPLKSYLDLAASCGALLEHFHCRQLAAFEKLQERAAAG